MRGLLLPAAWHCRPQREHSRCVRSSDASSSTRESSISPLATTDPLDGEFFIGSADWMFRNLSRRVEVVTPVTAPRRPREAVGNPRRPAAGPAPGVADGPRRPYTLLAPRPPATDLKARGTHQALIPLHSPPTDVVRRRNVRAAGTSMAEATSNGRACAIGQPKRRDPRCCAKRSHAAAAA